MWFPNHKQWGGTAEEKRKSHANEWEFFRKKGVLIVRVTSACNDRVGKEVRGPGHLRIRPKEKWKNDNRQGLTDRSTIVKAGERENRRRPPKANSEYYSLGSSEKGHIRTGPEMRPERREGKSSSIARHVCETEVGEKTNKT